MQIGLHTQYMRTHTHTHMRTHGSKDAGGGATERCYITFQIVLDRDIDKSFAHLFDEKTVNKIFTYDFFLILSPTTLD